MAATIGGPGSFPRLPRRLLRRQVLDKRLAEWAPVTVIRGVQGSGKTTLLADWLHRQPSSQVTTIWLALTRGLGADQLIGHLVRRLQAAGVIPPDDEQSDSAAMAAIDGALFELPAGRRLVLVLDNLYHLRDTAVLADLLGLVQRHAGFHLFVCIRGRHEFDTLGSGTVEVNTIRPDELMLSVDEVAELAERVGMPFRLEDVSRIHEALGGWTSAVRLAIEASTDGQVALAAAREYLLHTVGPGIVDRDTLTTMMKFSLATELDTRLVRDLAEDDPDKVLDRLESPGLLERHYRGEHIVLTMPTLVRELLREAYLARDAAAARTFHARLARWYAGHEGPDNDIIAVEHAVAGQDWRLVHEIWSEHGVRLGVVHRDRLRVALNSIPAETMTTYPGMQVTQLTLGRQPVDGQPAGWIAQTRTYAEISTRVLSRQRDVMPVADLIYTGTGHMVGLRLLGKFAESEKFARQVKAQTGERMTTEEPTGDRLGWFYLHRAITQTLVGDDDTAIRYYHRAWEHHLGSRATYLFAYVAANLAMTHVLRGEARTGQAWLEQYNAIEPTGTPADYLVGIGARVAAGFLALDRLDRDAAQSELAQLDDRSTATELWPFVAYLQAQYRLQFGHPGNALVSLDAGRAVYPPELTSSGAAALLLTRARADLLIVAEQGQRAGQLLDAYVAGTATADRTVLAVPRIRLRLLAGDNAAVLSMIGSFTAEQPTRVHDNLELLLLAAVAALRIGDSSGALRIMAHVPDVYEESRNLRAFATIPAAQREELFKLSGIELTPEEAATLRAHPEVYPAELILITLTKRENALLLALRAHASRQAIAEALYVSPNTVKTQIAGLYRKLGTTNRQDALIRAQELGLLS